MKTRAQKLSKSSVFLIALDEDGPIVGCLSDGQVQSRLVPVADKDDSQGHAIAQAAIAMREMGYSGQDVCLGLPSYMVMSAQIDAADLPKKHRHETLLYRLEEQLPLEAEDLTADFIACPGARAIGVGVHSGEVSSILEQLSREGIEVAFLCPTALLCLHQACNQDADKPDRSDASNGPEESHYVLIAGKASCDIFRMQEGRPLNWYWSPAGAAKIAKSIHADILGNPLGSQSANIVVVGELDAATIGHLQSEIPANLRHLGAEGPLDLAIRSASELASGVKAGWVDLRQGALRPQGIWLQMQGRLRLAVGLALLLLAVLAGMFAYRSIQYDAMADEMHQAQVREYLRLSPNSQVPESITSRLHSELAKLSGISGADQTLPQQTNGLQRLRQILANLPTTVKLRINEIRVMPAGAFLDGQVLTHSDAAAIADALNRGGMAADPPRTQALPGGMVSFTISVKWASAAGLPLPAKSGGKT